MKNWIRMTALAALTFAGCGDDATDDPLTDGGADTDADSDSDADADAGADAGSDDVTCEYGGAVYQEGESIDFPCNNCGNSCTCEEALDGAGSWSCTDCACAKECFVDDIVYEPGDTWDAGDGCNTCECVLVNLGMGYDEGQIQCTDLDCAI